MTGGEGEIGRICDPVLTLGAASVKEEKGQERIKITTMPCAGARTGGFSCGTWGSVRLMGDV